MCTNHLEILACTLLLTSLPLLKLFPWLGVAFPPLYNSYVIFQELLLPKRLSRFSQVGVNFVSSLLRLSVSLVEFC